MPTRYSGIAISSLAHSALTGVVLTDHISAAIQTGIAKAFVNINDDGTIASGSFGVSSITDSATGNRTINFATAFADALHSYALGIRHATGGRSHRFETPQVGDIQLLMTDGTTLTDVGSSSLHFGDQ